MIDQTHQICKWLNDIDEVLSYDIWRKPTIIDKQKIYLIKFQTRQYMGHAHKQFFFGTKAYPS